MPVSSKRKNHRKKVEAYKQRVAGEKKRAQEALMKMYQEQMQLQQQKMKQHVNGVDVENTDIDIDLGDMGVQVDTDVNIPTIEETSVIDTENVVKEPIKEDSNNILQSRELLDKIWDTHPNNPKNKKVEEVVEESTVSDVIKEKKPKKTSKK